MRRADDEKLVPDVMAAVSKGVVLGWMVLVITVGCGASTHELLRDGRFADACRAQEYEERGRFMEAVRAQARPSVHVHVYTVEELTRLLPAVPRMLSSGDRFIVGLRAEVVGDVEGTLTIRAAPSRDGRPFAPVPCCSEDEWARVWGGEVTERQQTVFERIARGVRIVGGTTVANVTDVMWAATGGAIDARVGTLEEGIITPRNLIEAALRAESSSADQPAQTPPDEPDAPEQEARTAAILRSLLDGDCEIEHEAPCTSFGFVEKDLLDGTSGAELRIVLEHSSRIEPADGPPDVCSVREFRTARLAGRGDDVASAINGLFADGARPLTDFELDDR